jgi:hypothetical protein
VNKHQLNRTFIYTCRRCKGECQSLLEIDENEQAEKRSADFHNYGKQLAGVFVYPFRGEGLMILLMGMLFFGLPLAISSLNVAVAILVLPLVAVVAIPSMTKAIEDSVVSDLPLGFPNIISDFGEMIGDIFKSALIFSLCFVPAFYIGNLSFLFWLFAGLGFYIFPMALLMLLFEDEIWLFHPQRFFNAILRTMGPYSVVPLFWIFLLLIEYFLEQTFLYKIYIWGYFFKAGALVYFIHLSMRPLGLFYRVYEKDMGFTDHHKKVNKMPAVNP